MRWYTLHPSLPTKAVLRIRTAPNSNASVCGRVAKGKAIAVRAPAFELPHDSPHATESVASALSQRWLHVALEDEASGSMMEGFVMANLPDGTSLLIPWEEEGFMCCCRVKDARAILFESSEPDAAIVGSVDAGEGWQFPFGVLQVAQTRARIFHDVFESVWIDLTELEEVCAASQHYGCSVRHAFFMLNEALPAEAQVAIRSFPSKEAETIALLSHSNVIEVVSSSGDWLQIYSEEYGEEMWIMRRTDTWQLLVEIPRHKSTRCKMVSSPVTKPRAPTFNQEASVSVRDDETASNQLTPEIPLAEPPKQKIAVNAEDDTQQCPSPIPGEHSSQEEDFPPPAELAETDEFLAERTESNSSQLNAALVDDNESFQSKATSMEEVEPDHSQMSDYDDMETEDPDTIATQDKEFEDASNDVNSSCVQESTEQMRRLSLDVHIGPLLPSNTPETAPPHVHADQPSDAVDTTSIEADVDMEDSTTEHPAIEISEDQTSSTDAHNGKLPVAAPKVQDTTTVWAWDESPLGTTKQKGESAPSSTYKWEWDERPLTGSASKRVNEAADQGMPDQEQPLPAHSSGKSKKKVVEPREEMHDQSQDVDMEPVHEDWGSTGTQAQHQNDDDDYVGINSSLIEPALDQVSVQEEKDNDSLEDETEGLHGHSREDIHCIAHPDDRPIQALEIEEDNAQPAQLDRSDTTTPSAAEPIECPTLSTKNEGDEVDYIEDQESRMQQPPTSDDAWRESIGGENEDEAPVGCIDVARLSPTDAELETNDSEMFEDAMQIDTVDENDGVELTDHDVGELGRSATEGMHENEEDGEDLQNAGSEGEELDGGENNLEGSVGSVDSATSADNEESSGVQAVTVVSEQPFAVDGSTQGDVEEEEWFDGDAIDDTKHEIGNNDNHVEFQEEKDSRGEDGEVVEDEIDNDNDGIDDENEDNEDCHGDDGDGCEEQVNDDDEQVTVEDEEDEGYGGDDDAVDDQLGNDDEAGGERVAETSNTGFSSTVDDEAEMALQEDENEKDSCPVNEEGEMQDMGAEEGSESEKHEQNVNCDEDGEDSSDQVSEQDVLCNSNDEEGDVDLSPSTNEEETEDDPTAGAAPREDGYGCSHNAVQLNEPSTSFKLDGRKSLNAGDSGLQYIAHHGVKNFCALKHAGNAKESSSEVYAAVMNDEDPDVVLEALSAEVQHPEQWFEFTAPPKSTSSDMGANILDVLYSRPAGNVSFRTPVKGANAPALPHTPMSSECRRERLNSIIQRTPVAEKAQASTSDGYDLIIGDGEPARIMEKEFGRFERFDMFANYSYPVLSGGYNHVPMDHSQQYHQPKTPQQSPYAPRTPIKVQAAISGEVAPVTPPRASRLSEPTPAAIPDANSYLSPAPSTRTSSLKRSASAIAKTPPVPKGTGVPETPPSNAQSSRTRTTSSLLPPSRLAKAPSTSGLVAPSAASPSMLKRPSFSQSQAPSSRFGSPAPTQRSSFSSAQSGTPSGIARATSRSFTAAGSADSSNATTPSRLGLRSTSASTTPSSLSKSTQSLLARKSLLQSTSRTGSSMLPQPVATAAPTSASTQPPAATRSSSFGFARPKIAVPKKYNL